MREIKFRAFIGNQMVYWGFIDDSFISPPTNLSNSENIFNVPQMQFTGLKDKNGKEIYEGDIVKVPTVETGPAIVGVIKYENNSLWFCGVDTSDWDGYIDFVETPEVIGNIYENPELLNQ